MTPRTEVEAVSVDSTLETIRAAVITSGHARLPVYEGSIDHIVGVLHVVDFYRALDRRHEHHEAEPFGLRPLLRGVRVVPETKPADDLLEEMRLSGQYFAVVIDEYGGTAGIVTLEDLMEALVGPMQQEVTVGKDAPTPAISRTAEGALVADGLLRLDEWEEATGLSLDEEDHAEVETLGGLVMARLGRIPDVGDTIQIAGRTLRVEELDGLRVSIVRLLPPDAGAGPDLPAASG